MKGGNMHPFIKICGLLLSLLVLSGCANENPIAAKIDNQLLENKKGAKAVLTPTKESNVRGVVTFIPVKEGIRIIADVEGLSPGKHGFHIHEKGDCSAPDAKSAGSHFNPTHAKHGSPDDPERHLGDLGNIEADSRGHAHYDRVDHVIALSGENSIIGKSVIVHSDADDYKTQPTGNAGSREACGVIVLIDK